ncbi:MAG: SufD family Fe-S cluster assembly protein [Actinomycetia bacterium]|nr:SufD family Fe-S cluster assembly protein [Actinomycetes bacterium]
MDNIAEKLLNRIADLEGTPEGAYNIRINGASVGRASSPNIEITSKTDVSGIDIRVHPGTKYEMVHIPVVIENSGYSETVYNDFYIGEDCDIIIIAGCGIHNDGYHLSQHDGVHRFHVGARSRVKYVEKHYGEGNGSGERVLNPVTEVFGEPDSYMEMDMVQIEGVDSTKRLTKAELADRATLIITERLMTSGQQNARTEFTVALNGEGSSANVISRSVAKGRSTQEFLARIDGNNACYGHSECDAIIMDEAIVTAIPEIKANNTEASLVHEAAIGKIAGEQIIKLMTLGLTREAAEAEIVNGFLK